jgi:N-acylneuraminate cytidylyltransferase
MKDHIKKLKAIAVIPARGGSKGIPRKNIIRIGGIPLIGRTIQAVKNCSSIDDIIVSTDDVEIAQIAKDYGADVIERPAKLAEDAASSEAAMLHACKKWHQLTGKRYELLLLAQNTSPFHDPGDMQRVIDLMQSDNYNSCITVTKTYRYFWASNKNGWHIPYQKRANRQKRQPWFEEAGSLYCVRYEMFCRDGNLFHSPVGTILVPKWRSHELDDPEDIKLANALCKTFKQSGH